MSQHLVVAHRTALSPELERAVRVLAAKDPAATFALLVPATPPSYWRPWDEARARDDAARVADQTAAALRGHGVVVSRIVTGGRDPFEAIQDELRDHPGYTSIVVSTLPGHSSRWLRLDLISRCRRAFGLPVTHVISGEARQASGPQPARRAEPAAAAPAVARAPHAPGLGRTPDEHLADHVQAHSAVREDDIAFLPISLSVPAELPPDERHLLAQLWDGDAGTVFRVLRSQPQILNGYAAMLQALWQAPGIEPALRELVVLRTAQLRNCGDLVRTHTEIARALGLSEERVAQVDRWESSYTGEFDARERATLRYVEALIRSPERAQKMHDHLREYVDEPDIVLITTLVGFYWLSAAIACTAAP